MATLFWRKYNQRRKAIELDSIGRIYRAIRGQYRAFLDSVDSNGYEYSVRHIDTIITVDGIDEALRTLYKKGAYLEYKFTANYLKKGLTLKSAAFGVGLDDLAKIIDEYFDIYLIHKTGVPISETTRLYIRKHLIDEVDKGVPLKQAIANFEQLALDARNTISKNRAINIARMESSRAMSFGSLVGAYMNGKPVEKIWVTCEDDRVRTGRGSRLGRYSHVALDMNIAELFGAFNNGEPIKFPGDPDANIANTANCRCTLYFREKVEVFQQEDKKRTLAGFLLNLLANTITNVSALLSQDSGS